MFRPGPLIFVGPFDEQALLGTIDNKVKSYLEQLGLHPGLNKWQIRRIVHELAKNHYHYNTPGYEDQSSISLTVSSNDRKIVIRSSGLIAEPQFSEFDTRVNFTRARDPEELDQLRQDMARNDIRPAMIGPCTQSKGRSIGTIEIASYLKEPITLERKGDVVQGLPMFLLTCPFLLSDPMRGNTALAILARSGSGITAG